LEPPPCQVYAALAPPENDYSGIGSVLSPVPGAWFGEYLGKADFVVNPYLATAGMDGGAMNCYLWDIGYAPNILALMLGKGLQPIARQLANVKLDQFYSFTPSGEGIGVPYSYSVWAFTNVVWALARHQAQMKSCTLKRKG
jgi:hypothetical protein